MKETFTNEDYVQLANIIDIASRRGAFGANEMLVIGTLHKKLVEHLKSQNIVPKPEVDGKQKQD